MSLSSDNAVLTMPVAPANTTNGNGNSMWGNDWSCWIILFLLFAFGGWGYGGFGGGFGGGGGVNNPGLQGLATRSDINEGFALNGLQTGQSGILSAVTNGFHGVDSAICNLGYQTQAGMNSLGSQLAQCCCDTREAIQGVNYNMATQANGIQNSIQGVRYDMATQACDTRNTIQNSTRDIIDNANANSRAILDFLTQDKIATLTAENQSLKFQASQAAQNAFITANQEAQTAELIRRINPMPVPAYQVPNPYAGCGCYSSCGCGC